MAGLTQLTVDPQRVVRRRGIFHVDPNEVVARRRVGDDGDDVVAAQCVVELQAEPRQLHAHVPIQPALLDVGEDILIGADDRGRFVGVSDLLAEHVDGGHLSRGVEAANGLARVSQLRAGDVPLGELLHERPGDGRQEADDRAVE